MKLTPARKRLLIYTSIIGGCAVLALIFFVISQYSRAKYVSSKAQLQGASKELVKLEEEKEKTEAIVPATNEEEVEKTVQLRLIEDKTTWYKGIEEYFTKENDSNSKAYKGTAIPAYTFSLLALVSFGFCLKHEDKVKEKEENQ